MRNMMQIWTTLPFRLQDNGWVRKALKEVAADKDGKIFNELRAKGIITTTLPLYGSEAVDMGNTVAKITHAGLKMYKNSDDFTRAVAWVAATKKFDDALMRFNAKQISAEEFSRMSGIAQMEPQTLGKIQTLMNNGNIRGARDLYGHMMTEETMFPYRSGMSPLAFKGTIGKLFGMMGQYPAYYVDNIRRALKYMTPKEKALAGTICT
jgi:hypothetical protein